MVLNTLGLGGVPEVAYQLIRHLPRDRFECSLFVLKASSSQHEARDERMRNCVDSGFEIRFATSEGGKFGVIADLAEWLSASRIDVMHTHSYRPNLYGRIAGAIQRPNGLQIIAHYHNQYDDKWNANPSSRKLEVALADASDAMIAVSRSVRSHIHECLGVSLSRIEVIPNGVDTTRFQRGKSNRLRDELGIDRSAFVVGLVGRVCEQKGQEDAVEAAILLKEQMPMTVFVMAGDIEDKALHSRLVKRIEDAGLSPNVRFLGHISDVHSVYAAIDLALLPSRWEGFGLTLVEAMAVGVPIVACNVGAVDEVTGGCAVLVPPRSPGALAEAIRSLASDKDRRTALVEAGAKRCIDFSWEAAADSVAAVYERVLERPSCE